MWMQTASGKKFQLLEPDVNLVDIGDIAHALSMQCRFNGHTRRFYSVAEHSVHVMHLMHPATTISGLMAALMHDAPEAYVGDIISPIKRSLPHFNDIEEGVARAIARRFNFGTLPIEDAEIKRADLFMAKTEALTLLDNPDLINEWGLPDDLGREYSFTPTLLCLDPPHAYELFMRTFMQLQYSRALEITS